jgi:hypothetical protein
MGSLRKLWQISEEKKMKNKKFLLGMLVLALVFGMTVIGCDEPEDPENPFKGDWTGNFGGTDGKATISFTDNTWTLTYGDSETLTGKYSKGTSKVNLKESSGKYTIGTSTYTAGILTVTINGDDDTPSTTGTFTRIKSIPTDPFLGAWGGTIGSSAATITFIDDATWSLTVGTGAEATTSTGTYTKKVGFIVTLKEGKYTIGTGTFNLTASPETLKIVFSDGDHEGKTGNFTRTTP